MDRRARFRIRASRFRVSLEPVQRVVAVHWGVPPGPPAVAAPVRLEPRVQIRQVRLVAPDVKRADKELAFRKAHHVQARLAPDGRAGRRASRVGIRLGREGTVEVRAPGQELLRAQRFLGEELPVARGELRLELEHGVAAPRALRFARPPVARDLPRRDLPRLLDQVGDTQGGNAVSPAGRPGPLGRSHLRCVEWADSPESVDTLARACTLRSCGLFEWSSRGVGTKNVDLGRTRTTPRGACASSMSGSVASMSSSAAVHLSNLAWRRAPTVAFGRVCAPRARGRARRGIAIVAKRSAKKRQSRKLEKRDDVRDMQKRMEERKAAMEAAAKFRPEPPPPPTNPTAAAERVRGASGGFPRSPGESRRGKASRARER